MTPYQLIERTAVNFRQHIRAKAGLQTNWISASEDMKNWYREMVERYLVATGELILNKGEE